MNRRAAATSVAAAFVAVVAGGGAHTWNVGARAMSASDDALARGDLVDAVDRAKLAAQAVVPGSPWPARGYARLEEIAGGAAARGDDVTSGRAWRAMRAAASSTSVLALGTGSDVARRREQADHAIAAAAAREVARAQPASPEAARQAEARVLDDLARDDTPGGGSFALVAAAALAFYGAVALWLWRTRGQSRGAA